MSHISREEISRFKTGKISVTSTGKGLLGKSVGEFAEITVQMHF
jgi:transcription elongation GreA/GreB family factor